MLICYLTGPLMGMTFMLTAARELPAQDMCRCEDVTSMPGVPFLTFRPYLILIPSALAVAYGNV
jgi:hypothetical protein